jgi:hypothetical protein
MLKQFLYTEGLRKHKFGLQHLTGVGSLMEPAEIPQLFCENNTEVLLEQAGCVGFTTELFRLNH